MLAALFFLVLQKAPPLTHIPPPGVSTQMSQAIHLIADLTQKGDYAGAQASLKLLPRHVVRFQWDDSAVGEASRSDFGIERDAAFVAWNGRLINVQFEKAKADVDLRFEFVPTTGVNLVWSTDPKEPRLTIRIGLKQGNGPIDPAAVFNDTAYGVGSYLGIEKLPFPGMIMAGTDLPASVRLGLNPIEVSIAIANLNSVEEVQARVISSKPIDPGLPSIAEMPAPVKGGPLIQGMGLPMAFQIKNSGSAPLVYKIVPDCSCFSVERVALLAPGQSGTAHAQMDTTEFYGVLHKKLYLFSNDQSNPIQEIPVEVSITPRYRMLPSTQILVSDGRPISFDAYLYFPPGHPIGVRAVSVEGIPAEVSYKPWQGSMADPDMSEGDLPRKGYKFTLTMKDIPGGGRFTTNIVVDTDDPGLPQIRYPVFVQQGILAMPASIFMAEVGRAPRRATVLLTGPGKTFKITDIQTDSKHLSATAEPGKSEGDYRITIEYDGQAAKGDYQATVSIKTDDPKQPLIQIPVSATVR